MDEYYIIVNGVQEGPMSKTDLVARGLTAESYVWKAGLPNWVKAADVPELSDLLVEESAFGSYAEPLNEPPQFVQEPQEPQGPHIQQEHQYAPGSDRNSFNNNGYQHEIESYVHFDWNTWAIIATVVGFLTTFVGGILGVIGIVQANKANELYAAGRILEARTANSSAKAVIITSLVLSALLIGICILAVIFVLASMI